LPAWHAGPGPGRAPASGNAAPGLLFCQDTPAMEGQMRLCLRRREFIAGLGGSAAAWPLAARAQQGDRVRRIGVLISGDENDPLTPLTTSELSAFTQALADLGWTWPQRADRPSLGRG